jgi:glycosyltransferase involved in cell wall biosynthesis
LRYSARPTDSALRPSPAHQEAAVTRHEQFDGSSARWRESNDRDDDGGHPRVSYASGVRDGVLSDRGPIWILDDSRTLGGGQRFNLRLCNSLGPETTIVCVRGSSLQREALALGLRVVEAAFPTPSVGQLPALLSAARKLRELIPPEAVVLSGAMRATLVALLARLPNPTVVLMHEQASASRLSVRLALRRHPAMIVVGPESAAEYRRALPGASIWTVNNFLSADQFSEFAAARKTATPTPGSQRPALGVVARLIPGKGVDALVSELAQQTDVWASLQIAGGRQDESHAQLIERTIRGAGLERRVTLLGEVTDLPSFLAKLDALVVPSVEPEGQPTVILEGLAAGLPVIVRRSMQSSAFADLPVVGYENPNELRERLLNLPSAAGPEPLADRFGIDQCLRGLEDAISSAKQRVSTGR